MARKTKARAQGATSRYLDEVIQHESLASDYALAHLLGISTQAVYKMRAGGLMGAATAAKIAHILGRDPLKVIADVELERGSQDDFWRRIRDAAAFAFGFIAAALLCAHLVSGGGFDINEIGVPVSWSVHDATGIHIVPLAALAALIALALLALHAQRKAQR